MNPTDPNTPPSTPASSNDAEALARIAKITSARLDAGTATAPPAGTPGGTLPKSTLMGEMVGKVLAVIARTLSPEFVEKSLTFARNFGQYAVLAGAALTLLYAIFAAIKFDSLAVFLTGAGIIVAIAIGQFAAIRFLGAAVQTIANTPSRVSSSAFLECTGLLALLFGLVMLVGGLIACIQLESVAPLPPALLVTVSMTYFGALALHPRLVNVDLGEGSAGEEAIGLLSFFFKAGLKLVPLFFFLLAVGGCLAIIASFFQGGQAFARMIVSVLQMLPMPISAPHGLAASTVVLVACLLPLMAYFLFLLQYLLLDVLRAILSLPSKLDSLRARQP